MHGWIVRLALAALMVMVASVSLRAQDSPTPEQLRDAFTRQVAAHLAPVWRLADVTLEAADAVDTVEAGEPANAGGPGDAATLRLRLAATFALTETLYVGDGTDGPVQFIRPYAEAGVEKTLPGSGLATRQGEVWHMRFAMPYPEGLMMPGGPRGAFMGRTLVRGSAEEAAYLAQRQAELSAQFQAEAAAQDVNLQVRRTENTALEQQMLERARGLAMLGERLAGRERAERLAALEAGLASLDGAARMLAFESALGGDDPAAITLALRHYFLHVRILPVVLFATQEEPVSAEAIHRIGPFQLAVDRLNVTTGVVEGRMGASGFPTTQPSEARGTLNQSELTLASSGCTLNLRLTEHRTLDGLLRCLNMPALIARIALP